jgi:hypothetical protein
VALKATARKIAHIVSREIMDKERRIFILPEKNPQTQAMACWRYKA